MGNVNAWCSQQKLHHLGVAVLGRQVQRRVVGSVRMGNVNAWCSQQKLHHLSVATLGCHVQWPATDAVNVYSRCRQQQPNCINVAGFGSPDQRRFAIIVLTCVDVDIRRCQQELNHIGVAVLGGQVQRRLFITTFHVSIDAFLAILVGRAVAIPVAVAIRAAAIRDAVAIRAAAIPVAVSIRAAAIRDAVCFLPLPIGSNPWRCQQQRHHLGVAMHGRQVQWRAAIHDVIGCDAVHLKQPPCHLRIACLGCQVQRCSHSVPQQPVRAEARLLHPAGKLARQLTAAVPQRQQRCPAVQPVGNGHDAFFV